MQLSPDEMIYWRWDFVTINATVCYSWIVLLLTAVGSWLVTRKLTASTRLTRGQNLLEVLLGGVCDQIREVSGQDPRPYLPFVGTLFVYIAVANLLSIVPGFESPTGSLSTTAALAMCVFFAVPFYGISRKGVKGYLASYVSPSVVMLPFNIVGEVSRTLALAVRLFGNVMSGSLIVAVLLAIAPLVFPAVMNLLGILTGVIQAYIFAMLAMVYIAAATDEKSGQPPPGAAARPRAAAQGSPARTEP